VADWIHRRVDDVVVCGRYEVGPARLGHALKDQRCHRMWPFERPTAAVRACCIGASLDSEVADVFGGLLLLLQLFASLTA